MRLKAKTLIYNARRFSLLLLLEDGRLHLIEDSADVPIEVEHLTEEEENEDKVSPGFYPKPRH